MRCGARDAAECLGKHIQPHVLGATLAGNGLSLRGLAPCHNDATPSLSVSVVSAERIVWNCFSCARLLGKQDAQKLTRNALIIAGVPAICLPQSADDASDDLEAIRAVISGKGSHAYKVLMAAALLEGRSGLPQGDELEALAESCGVSHRQAYRARGGHAT